MKEINNFDVLKRMAEQNKNVQLCTTITEMNYSAKKGGTEVTIGVPGNICFDVRDGKKNCLLLLFDIKEFYEVKDAMTIEALETTKTLAEPEAPSAI